MRRQAVDDVLGDGQGRGASPGEGALRIAVTGPSRLMRKSSTRVPSRSTACGTDAGGRAHPSLTRNCGHVVPCRSHEHSVRMATHVSRAGQPASAPRNSLRAPGHREHPDHVPHRDIAPVAGTPRAPVASTAFGPISTLPSTRGEVDAEERVNRVGHRIHAARTSPIPFWPQPVVLAAERHDRRSGSSPASRATRSACRPAQIVSCANSYLSPPATTATPGPPRVIDVTSAPRTICPPARRLISLANALATAPGSRRSRGGRRESAARRRRRRSAPARAVRPRPASARPARRSVARRDSISHAAASASAICRARPAGDLLPILAEYVTPCSGAELPLSSEARRGGAASRLEAEARRVVDARVHDARSCGRTGEPPGRSLLLQDP